MKRVLAASVLTAAFAVSALTAGTALAAMPNAVNISVGSGSLTFNQKTYTANAGLVRINFTNHSTAPHNVSLEHNGEFEYGATLTITKSTLMTTTFLTLAKGSYHLYSSVGKDEDKGMAATLIVK